MQSIRAGATLRRAKDFEEAEGGGQRPISSAPYGMEEEDHGCRPYIELSNEISAHGSITDANADLNV